MYKSAMAFEVTDAHFHVNHLESLRLRFVLKGVLQRARHVAYGIKPLEEAIIDVDSINTLEEAIKRHANHGTSVREQR